MTEQRKLLEAELAGLALKIYKAEELLAHLKMDYWEKVRQIHNEEAKLGLDFFQDRLAKAEVERMRDDSFKLAKGAVTCDDT